MTWCDARQTADQRKPRKPCAWVWATRWTPPQFSQQKHSGPNILEWAYPSELFPREVRASAIGITTGASRIGAAIGTFVIPFALRDRGIGPTMLAAAGLTALGWLICVLMAEETKGMSLAAAAGGKETIPAAAPENQSNTTTV
ncbi:MFS transporter [Arthrobacter cavernae]|uniref:MFS transporter n=1 Tax=Arthrobacter cavernae TaxID=2817681 RepID=A0A939HGL1_9MICC|nr:MFS transporter [Arthrobacter cavernae]MBO1268060.1 MFS transporter [Arthrobacter cavernae]